MPLFLPLSRRPSRARPARVLGYLPLLAAAVLLVSPRVALAGNPCTLPSDCFSTGLVCQSGLCVGCESNFSDAGTGFLACTNPDDKVCDIPMGSLNGACVQCLKSTDCAAMQSCDTTTNTCVAADAGRTDGGGAGDGGARDASAHDASGDASGAKDSGHGDGSSTDATTLMDATPTGDGAAPHDGAAKDASSGDGSTRDGSADARPMKDAAPDARAKQDATLDGSSEAGAGGYIEGGGCSCRAAGSRHDDSSEVAFGALFVLGAGVVVRARRKSR